MAYRAEIYGQVFIAETEEEVVDMVLDHEEGRSFKNFEPLLTIEEID